MKDDYDNNYFLVHVVKKNYCKITCEFELCKSLKTQDRMTSERTMSCPRNILKSKELKTFLFNYAILGLQ